MRKLVVSMCDPIANKRRQMKSSIIRCSKETKFLMRCHIHQLLDIGPYTVAFLLVSYVRS